MAAQMVQMYNIYQTRERTSRRERKKQENQMFFIVFELWKILLGFRSCLLLEFVHHLPLFPLKVCLRAHKNLRLRLHRAFLYLNSEEFVRISSVAVGNQTQGVEAKRCPKGGVKQASSLIGQKANTD